MRLSFFLVARARRLCLCPVITSATAPGIYFWLLRFENIVRTIPWRPLASPSDALQSNSFPVNMAIDFCLPLVYQTPCSRSKTLLSSELFLFLHYFLVLALFPGTHTSLTSARPRLAASSLPAGVYLARSPRIGHDNRYSPATLSLLSLPNKAASPRQESSPQFRRAP